MLYRGHAVALVVFLSPGLTIGTSQYAFGEFAGPLRAEFGWSQTALNLSLSFWVIPALLAPLIGRMSDWWGIRRVVFVSLLSISAGFLVRPLASELWHWYLFSTLVYLGFPGVTVLAAGKLVGLWYPATGGRMMARSHPVTTSVASPCRHWWRQSSPWPAGRPPIWCLAD